MTINIAHAWAGFSHTLCTQLRNVCGRFDYSLMIANCRMIITKKNTSAPTLRSPADTALYYRNGTQDSELKQPPRHSSLTAVPVCVARVPTCVLIAVFLSLQSRLHKKCIPRHPVNATKVWGHATVYYDSFILLRSFFFFYAWQGRLLIKHAPPPIQRHYYTTTLLYYDTLYCTIIHYNTYKQQYDDDCLRPNNRFLIAGDLARLRDVPLLLSVREGKRYALRLASVSALLAYKLPQYKALCEKVHQLGINARWTHGWSGLVSCYSMWWADCLLCRRYSIIVFAAFFRVFFVMLMFWPLFCLSLIFSN